MKKLLFTLPLLALTNLAVHGQGYIYFANYDQGLTVEKRISDEVTGDYVTSSFQAQLFVGPNGSLASVLSSVDSPVQFVDSPPGSEGEFVGYDMPLAGFNPGDTVTLEVRVWPTTYATWNQAYIAALSDANIHVGRSGAFTLVLGTLVSPTEMVTYMPLFTVGIIPEPSTMWLGGLGLGMMFLRRRSA